MGIATLLVIFGHSVGNGVAMPRWMESLCGLSSVGVDIFLLVSGLGLWYSLTSLNGNNVQQGVRCWYLRRYKRILIPYLIIIGFHGSSSNLVVNSLSLYFQVNNYPFLLTFIRKYRH